MKVKFYNYQKFYLVYLGSSKAAFCQGKHPVRQIKITTPNCQISWVIKALKAKKINELVNESYSNNCMFNKYLEFHFVVIAKYSYFTA